MPTNSYRPLPTGVTKLALGGAVEYRPAWLTPSEAQALYAEVQARAEYRIEKIFTWGRWRDQPRATAWFGRWYLASSKYSRYTEAPALGPHLAALTARIGREWGLESNAVLVNRYRPGDAVSWHADNERLLAPAPIVSVSLGAERTFRIRPEGKDDAARLATGGEHLTARARSGDVIVMSNEMQNKRYVHAVPSFAADRGERINLTFRQYTGGVRVPPPW